MGMFDSLYDQQGTEWQTKAFDCLLNGYRIGDELPGPPIDYQVEILGGRIELGEDVSRDSYATIRAGILETIASRQRTTHRNHHHTHVTHDI